MNKSFILIIIFILFVRQILFLYADSDTYINTSNITYNEETNVVEFAEGQR